MPLGRTRFFISVRFGEAGWVMRVSQGILDEVQVSVFESGRGGTEAYHANLHSGEVQQESFLVLNTTGEVYSNLPRIDPVNRTYARQRRDGPIDALFIDVP